MVGPILYSFRRPCTFDKLYNKIKVSLWVKKLEVYNLKFLSFMPRVIKLVYFLGTLGSEYLIL